jgi:hypothetical protein
MVKRGQYIEYLIASPRNYTCSNLAEHLEVSHDSVSDFLAQAKVRAGELWEQAKELINDDLGGYLIVDDSVQDKRYSAKIELARYQWSGLEGRVIKGIGVVNLTHVNGSKDGFYPVDYRLYNPDDDSKTKNQHFRDMLLKAKVDKEIKANKVLFDSWYSSVDNLKFIHRLGMVFYGAIKPNRLVSISKEAGYCKPSDLGWTEEALQRGIEVKLKELPFKVRLFKLVTQNGDIDWMITNNPDSTLTTQVVQQENEVRWKIEQVHRDVKQLLGSEACQCRKARSQRNHIGLVYQAWVSLAVHARNLGQTLYQVKQDLLRDYLISQLKLPTVQAFRVT